MQSAAPPHFAEGEVPAWEEGSVAGTTLEATSKGGMDRTKSSVLENVHPHSRGYPGSEKLVCSRNYPEVRVIATAALISTRTTLV